MTNKGKNKYEISATTSFGSIDCEWVYAMNEEEASEKFYVENPEYQPYSIIQIELLKENC